MRSLASHAVGAALLIAYSTMAPAQVGSTAQSSGNQCLNGYHQYSFNAPTPIPDADRAGVRIGPLSIPDEGSTLGGVVLRLGISHPATEDVQLWLCYDAKGDGSDEVRAPIELYKARTDGCEAREANACPSDLNGAYYFKGDDSEGADAALSVLNPLRRGGSFYLVVADTLAQDTGVVTGWAVYLKEPAITANALRSFGPGN